jgi:hypothetical protein
MQVQMVLELQSTFNHFQLMKEEQHTQESKLLVGNTQQAAMEIPLLSGLITHGKSLATTTPFTVES